jgi:endonuclease V-like protein UPF0215 family
LTPTELAGLRLFGVEDGSFEAFPTAENTYCFLCGVETKASRIVSIKLTKIQVDGFDATEKLLSMLEAFGGEAVILGGITFAGFNIVDPVKIHQETGTPVIVYSGKKPDNEGVLSALKAHFGDWRKRWRIIQSLGPIHTTRPFLGEPPVYFEVVGNTREWGEEILAASAEVSRIPEPVRVAGIVARSLSPAC